MWYPVNFQIPRYSEDYVKSKLGVTDPIKQRDLRIEFYEAIRNAEIRTDEVEYHTLKIGDEEYPFYINDKTNDSVVVFIEKGLNTLKPDPKTGVWNHPHGYPWSKIYISDRPEQIASDLYDEDIKFGVLMKETLDNIMGWLIP